MAPAVGALGARRWAAVVRGLARFTTVCVTDLTPGLRFVAVGITLPALCVAVFIAGTTALAGSPVAVSLAGATTLAGPSTPDSLAGTVRLGALPPAGTAGTVAAVPALFSAAATGTSAIAGAARSSMNRPDRMAATQAIRFSAIRVEGS